MSHDRGWLAGCVVTRWILNFHFEICEVARGVTAMVVGSGALLALAFISNRASKAHQIPINILGLKVTHAVWPCAEG